MPFMMCLRGHLFNADIYDSCNVCAEEEGRERSTILLPDTELDPTIGLGRTGTILNVAEAPAPGFGLDLSGGAGVVKQERTHVQLPTGNAELRRLVGEGEILPVVGWLVIITGPGAGRDFRLIPGQNYIGRDQDMEVCLDFGDAGDPMVSRREHALVVYDMEDNECYLSDRTQSRNLPRLNGKSVRTATTLKSGDIIQVGGTRFLFIPLCGESFNWGSAGGEA